MPDFGSLRTVTLKDTLEPFRDIKLYKMQE
jgi:hypothetical protein